MSAFIILRLESGEPSSHLLYTVCGSNTDTVLHHSLCLLKYMTHRLKHFSSSGLLSQVLSAEYQSTPASSPSAVFLFTRYACEPKITSELRALWVVCLCEHITYSSAVYLVEQRQWRSSRHAGVKCDRLISSNTGWN